MRIIYIYSMIIKIGVMCRGLSWAGTGSAGSAPIGFFMCEDLLLVLLDHLVVLRLTDGHEIYQLVIYMHEITMQCLGIYNSNS